MSETSEAPRKITIFDTTLRDGEQCPGASMNLSEKLDVARALVMLGVDVIEAGFPIASPGDFESVRQIAREVEGATICGLARCVNVDIDRAGEAVAPAKQRRIHVFLATSPIHREFKLRMTKEEVIQNAVAGVKRAKGYCEDIEFSPEDASRTEPDFLCEVVGAVIAAGATTVNIPDTVGYATPDTFAAQIRMLKQQVQNIEQAVISVHCHNDLGMAVANSLAAVSAGAGQIECAINGLGERAGNCALEEVVMAIRTRQDFYHAFTGIVTPRIVPTSRLVSGITGMQVQRNKAIVGQNAFAHESGIHQAGMLRNATTYEIMRPEDVGLTKSDLVLGKHSGRAAIGDRAKDLGYQLTSEQLDDVVSKFKSLADRKKTMYDADLVAIIEKQVRNTDAKTWTLERYALECGSDRHPHTILWVRCGETLHKVETEEGDGPIDSVFLALEKLTGLTGQCKEFRVHSVTVGKDAQGEVNVEIDYHGSTYRGRGVSTDTIQASAEAFLMAMNRIAAAASLA